MILWSKTPSGAPPVSRADLQIRRACGKLKFSYKVAIPGSDSDWIVHHLPRCVHGRYSVTSKEVIFSMWSLRERHYAFLANAKGLLQVFDVSPSQVQSHQGVQEMFGR